MDQRSGKPDPTEGSVQVGGGDVSSSTGGPNRPLIGVLVGVLVLLVAVVALATNTDDDDGMASDDAAGAQAAFDELPPLEEVPMIGCLTATSGPPGAQLVDAGVAVTADQVLFVAETAAEPIFSGDLAEPRADDGWISFDFTIWQQSEPDAFVETYVLLHPPTLSPGGLIDGTPIDTSHVESGRDGRYSWVVVDRDGLPVVDGDPIVGVTVTGISEVYVEPDGEGSADVAIVNRVDAVQWCPDEERVHVVELPPR